MVVIGQQERKGRRSKEEPVEGPEKKSDETKKLLNIKSIHRVREGKAGDTGRKGESKKC